MIQELTELLPVIAGPNQVCPGETSTLFIGGTFESTPGLQEKWALILLRLIQA